MPLDFPSNPANGDLYQGFVYDSSITAWRNQGSPSGLAGQVVALDNKMGLKNVVPPTTATFVTGTGSVSSLGKISFSGCTSISLDGVFSSKYQNYRIVSTLTSVSASTDFFFRLRAGGVDKTAATYHEAGFYAVSASLTNNYRGSTTSSVVTWTATGLTAYSVRELSKPFIVDYTQWLNSATYGTANMLQWSGTHAENASCDGFTMYMATGTISGNIQIFGYNE